MKVLKKPITLALVIALAVVFSALASASSAIPSTGILEVGTNGVIGDSEDALSEITFSVKLTNAEGYSDIPRPGTLFDYTVSESGTANGPTVSIASVTFGLNNNGAEDTKNVTLNITDTSDTATPGVHTYTITQAINTAASAAGFAVGLETAYLDLYVNNNHEVYGAVLRNAEIPQDAQNPDDYKIAGFENTYTPTSVNVTKLVTGAAGANHAGDAFEFGIEIKVPYDAAYVNTDGLSVALSGDNNTFTTQTVTVNFNEVQDGFYTATLTGTLQAGAKSDALQAESFSNLSNTLTISGLPAGSSVKATENITGDYQATSKYWYGSGALTTVINGVGESTGDTTGTEVTTSTANTVGNIVYINALEYEYISPTGVALRFAPYLFMLGAGVTLPAMSIRRRKEEEF